MIYNFWFGSVSTCDHFRGKLEYRLTGSLCPKLVAEFSYRYGTGAYQLLGQGGPPRIAILALTMDCLLNHCFNSKIWREQVYLPLPKIGIRNLLITCFSGGVWLSGLQHWNPLSCCQGGCKDLEKVVVQPQLRSCCGSVCVNWSWADVKFTLHTYSQRCLGEGILCGLWFLTLFYRLASG